MKPFAALLIFVSSLACPALRAVNLPVKERPVLEAELTEFAVNGEEAKGEIISRLIMNKEVGNPEASSFDLRETSVNRCDGERCSEGLVNGHFTVTFKGRAECNLIKYVAALLEEGGSRQIGVIELVDHTQDTCGTKAQYGWTMTLRTETSQARHLGGNPQNIFTIMNPLGSQN